MDLLMMWPLLVWILAVMLGRLHEYSGFVSEREWMLKVTSEGNGGPKSLLRFKSVFHHQQNEIPENQSKTLEVFV